jgi:hypothetical protein
MGHWAWGIGHGALGMGHGLLILLTLLPCFPLSFKLFRNPKDI